MRRTLIKDKEMKNYRITYDTTKAVNQTFEVSADSEEEAWDEFYWEVEAQEEVTEKFITEI